MEKHYVGSEIGQLRSVMLHRPNLSLSKVNPLKTVRSCYLMTCSRLNGR